VAANACNNVVYDNATTEAQNDPVVAAGTAFSWFPSGMAGSSGTLSGPRGEVPLIFPQYQTFNNAASIGSTSLGTTNSTGNGVYVIHYWIQTAQAGSNGGSVTTQFTWTDGLFGSGPANIPSPANILGDVVSGEVIIRSGNSVTVNFSTTYACPAACSPAYQYEIKITVEYKG
jgi:hypothetical protein